MPNYVKLMKRYGQPLTYGTILGSITGSMVAPKEEWGTGALVGGLLGGMSGVGAKALANRIYFGTTPALKNYHRQVFRKGTHAESDAMDELLKTLSGEETMLKNVARVAPGALPVAAGIGSGGLIQWLRSRRGKAEKHEDRESMARRVKNELKEKFGFGPVDSEAGPTQDNNEEESSLQQRQGSSQAGKDGPS